MVTVMSVADIEVISKVLYRIIRENRQLVRAGLGICSQAACCTTVQWSNSVVSPAGGHQVAFIHIMDSDYNIGF